MTIIFQSIFSKKNHLLKVCTFCALTIFSSSIFAQDSTSLGGYVSQYSQNIPNQHKFSGKTDITMKKKSILIEGATACSPNGPRIAYATCPANTTLVGGGYKIFNWSSDGNAPDASMPMPQLNSWYVDAGGWPKACFKSYALCDSY